MSQDAAEISARKLAYRLRSVFFLSKLREMGTLRLPDLLVVLLPHASRYSWAERRNWGIDEQAFQAIAHHAHLVTLQVFCHPDVVRAQPKLLAYYRHIAVLPQKAITQLLHIDIGKYEMMADGSAPISDRHALSLVQLVNEHISLVVNSALETFSPDDLVGMLLASAGSQIDGSWRNALGKEAEQTVRRLIIQEASERGIIAEMFLRNAAGQEPPDAHSAQEERADVRRYRGLRLTNNAAVMFASEPDIALISSAGTTTGIVEVKGGTDSAGALERFGAVLKSFEAARRRNETVATLLVSYLLTTAARDRLRHDLRIEVFDLNLLLEREQPEYRRL